MTTYRIAPAPKHADMIEWNCLLCGHESLTRPVFLEGNGAVFAAGTRCAAIALYGNESSTAQRKVRNAFDLAQHQAKQAQELRNERMVRYSAALVAFGEGRDGDMALRSARKAFHATKPLGMNFPQFIEHVATTGDFPG